jgi:protein-tyrosine phosphatase
MTIEKILFVCYGNTARSPVAEYLARQYAEINELDLEFESAGFINAFSYIQPESREYLDSKDIDYYNFHPQLITSRLIESHDLILTMENSHKIEILRKYPTIPNIKNKVFTLREFNGETVDLDIIDPYYGSYKTYQKVLKIIDENISKALKKIQNMYE